MMSDNNQNKIRYTGLFPDKHIDKVERDLIKHIEELDKNTEEIKSELKSIDLPILNATIYNLI